MKSGIPMAGPPEFRRREKVCKVLSHPWMVETNGLNPFVQRNFSRSETRGAARNAVNNSDVPGTRHRLRLDLASAQVGLRAGASKRS